MTEQVMELVRALCGPGQSEAVLYTLCEGACRALDWRLKDGLTAEDCGGAYPLAAAWMAMDWLRGSQGMDGVTYLSAGDLSVRREGGGDNGSLSQRALEIMAPYLQDDGFVFQGVKG